VPFILILGLVEGAIVSFTQPVADAYLASVADPRVQGRVQGAFVTIGMAGAAISALLGSVLYDISPVVPFLVGGGVMAALTCVAVYFVRETEHRRTLLQTTHRTTSIDSSLAGTSDVSLAPSASSDVP
jgi:MFS family permease